MIKCIINSRSIEEKTVPVIKLSYRVDWVANFIKLLIGIFRTPKSPTYDHTPHAILVDLWF